MALNLNFNVESNIVFMKKILLAVTVCIFMATAQNATAQLRININIGSQPAWGPAGYDYVEYYYLPEPDIYYYVPSSQFVYLSNGRWIFANSLPARYRSYNLYNTYKVVVNEPRPYLRHSVYQSRFARYKGWSGRQTLNHSNGKYKSFRNNGNGRGHH